MEDNNGFVNFPVNNRNLVKLDVGKTFIYIVAFDSMDIGSNPNILSNNRIIMPGTFVGDDVMLRPKVKDGQMTIDSLIEDGLKNDQYDRFYFPNFGEKSKNNIMSIPMISSICVGWFDLTFEFRDTIGFWSASFGDLTGEGKKLYYSMKKLHNNKEVRILTFNNI